MQPGLMLINVPGDSWQFNNGLIPTENRSNALFSPFCYSFSSRPLRENEVTGDCPELESELAAHERHALALVSSDRPI